MKRVREEYDAWESEVTHCVVRTHYAGGVKTAQRLHQTLFEMRVFLDPPPVLAERMLSWMQRLIAQKKQWLSERRVVILACLERVGIPLDVRVILTTRYLIRGVERDELARAVDYVRCVSSGGCRELPCDFFEQLKLKLF